MVYRIFNVRMLPFYKQTHGGGGRKGGGGGGEGFTASSEGL